MIPLFTHGLGRLSQDRNSLMIAGGPISLCRERMSFDELESKIGLAIDNRDLLTVAFTHGSVRGKTQNKDAETYRRLEFVGDALLRLAVSESLYRDSNGDVEMLHNKREKLIPNRFLTSAAKELGLTKYLIWSGSQDVVRSPKVPAKLYEA